MNRLACLGVLLVGCGPSLAGTWTGDLSCDTLTFDLSTDLAKAGKNLFTGPLSFGIDNTSDGGATLSVVVAYDAEVRINGGDAQELDFEVDFVSAACEARDADGSLRSDDCDALGFDTTALEQTRDELDGSAWDGEDTIDIDADGCAGQLVRTR